MLWVVVGAIGFIGLMLLGAVGVFVALVVIYCFVKGFFEAKQEIKQEKQQAKTQARKQQGKQENSRARISKIPIAVVIKPYNKPEITAVSGRQGRHRRGFATAPIAKGSKHQPPPLH